MNRIYLIAPTHQMATQIAKEEGLRPMEWRYVPQDDPRELQGLSDATVWIHRAARISVHLGQALQMLKYTGNLKVQRHVGRPRTHPEGSLR